MPHIHVRPLEEERVKITIVGRPRGIQISVSIRGEADTHVHAPLAEGEVYGASPGVPVIAGAENFPGRPMRRRVVMGVPEF